MNTYTTLFKIWRYQRSFQAGKSTWYRPLLKGLPSPSSRYNKQVIRLWSFKMFILLDPYKTLLLNYTLRQKWFFLFTFYIIVDWLYRFSFPIYFYCSICISTEEICCTFIFEVVLPNNVTKQNNLLMFFTQKKFKFRIKGG